MKKRLINLDVDRCRLTQWINSRKNGSSLQGSGVGIGMILEKEKKNKNLKIVLRHWHVPMPVLSQPIVAAQTLHPTTASSRVFPSFPPRTVAKMYQLCFFFSNAK